MSSNTSNTHFEKEVYSKYYTLVYSTCMRKLHQKDQINDAVQSTFLLYIKDQDNINSNLSSWFYWSSKNICTYMNREASKHNMHADLDTNIADRKSSRNDIYFEKLLSSLSKRKSDLLLMRYFDKLSYQEIAEKTNTKEASVRKVIERTISFLQSKFKKKDVLITAMLATLFHASEASASALSSNSFIIQNSLNQQSIVKGVLKMNSSSKLITVLAATLLVSGILGMTILNGNDDIPINEINQPLNNRIGIDDGLEEIIEGDHQGKKNEKGFKDAAKEYDKKAKAAKKAGKPKLAKLFSRQAEIKRKNAKLGAAGKESDWKEYHKNNKKIGELNGGKADKKVDKKGHKKGKKPGDAFRSAADEYENKAKDAGKAGNKELEKLYNRQAEIKRKAAKLGDDNKWNEIDWKEYHENNKKINGHQKGKKHHKK
ncbi:MAG: hypothetical protein COA79_18195 [Planctomycetota bacterium]|nr:MAG: hypothetical protein COA79_18195 [Planctomycetota bacterium]